MATGFYNRFLYRMMNQLIGPATDFRWLLLRNSGSYSFNPDHDFVDDIFSNGGVEISVASYARQAASSGTVTLDDATDRSIYSEGTVDFGSLEAGQTVSGFLLYEHVTDDSDSIPCFFTDGNINLSIAAPVAAPLTYNITGASRSNPVVISSAGHTFTNGMKVKITGVGGMTQINNRVFTIGGVVAGTSYQLTGENGTAYGVYTAGGSAKEVKTAYITATHDSIVSDSAVNFSGVTGSINGNWPASSTSIEIMDLSSSLAAGALSQVQSQVLLPAPLGGGLFTISFNAAGFWFLRGGKL